MRLAGRAHAHTDLVDGVDRSRFPADPWRLIEKRFDASDMGATETLFSVGNGYLGLRGNVEEGHEAFAHGTFINGFHETWPIRHAEEAYGFARTGQTIVNVPDAKVMRVYVDDEPLELAQAELLEYERVLDLRTGVLTRDLLWRTPAGNRVRVRSSRLVSFEHRHVAILSLDVTPLDAGVPVTVSSHLLNRQAGADEYRSTASGLRIDPRKPEPATQRVLEPRLHRHERDRLVLGYECARSGMTLSVAAHHRIACEAPIDVETVVEADFAKQVYTGRLEAGQTLSLTKVVSYHTSDAVPPHELADRCHRTIDRVMSEGIEEQRARQAAWLEDFWRRSDVVIEGTDVLQQAVRWSLFQLAQAAARADGEGIPAKGVSGAGYGGHYFWDTEIYVVPFFTYTSPTIARNALKYRYRILPAARQRAAELAQRGALYPWRTINGEEASAYYAAGTAQYHIDADIAYAINKYVRATGDEDFLVREGIDVLVETARMWADLGFWREQKGKPATFRIHGVTGPDEYTTVVNDNLYTNVMARFNLRCAAESVHLLSERYPDAHADMVRRLALADDEVAQWEAAAEAMEILWDDNLGIHPQDALFHEREVWDLAHTPPEKRPLLLHFHPLVIYRFQVLKQADVVLALFLQSEHFTREEKLADFEYYDPITTGDSTLSAVVQSIISAEVGYQDLALRYFWDAALVDLADLHSNTSDGVHVASAGGVWSALVFGFAGMRDHGSVFRFDPRLPRSWDALEFVLTRRDARLRVRLESRAMHFSLDTGDRMTVEVRRRRFEVRSGQVTTVPLENQGPLIPGAPDPTKFHGAVRADGTVITASLPPAAGDPDVTEVPSATTDPWSQPEP